MTDRSSLRALWKNRGRDESASSDMKTIIARTIHFVTVSDGTRIFFGVSGLNLKRWRRPTPCTASCRTRRPTFTQSFGLSVGGKIIHRSARSSTSWRACSVALRARIAGKGCGERLFDGLIFEAPASAAFAAL
jgi:hypothetical protein